jgi:hypothetical protein
LGVRYATRPIGAIARDSTVRDAKRSVVRYAAAALIDVIARNGAVFNREIAVIGYPTTPEIGGIVLDGTIRNGEGAAVRHTAARII